MIDLEDFRLKRLMKFGDLILDGHDSAERSMYFKGATDAWYLAQLIECEKSDGGSSLRDILELLSLEPDEPYYEAFKRPLLEIIQMLINHRDNVEAKNESNVDEP